MAHYPEHTENKVGHRRAKMMLKTGGYARGGHDDAAADRKLMKKMMAEHEKEEGDKHEGAKCGGRLDKRARGGKKRETGGSVSSSTYKPKTFTLSGEPREKETFAEAATAQKIKSIQTKKRGGVAKRAMGGGVHNITPSKRKPHMNVNIINVTRGGNRGRRFGPRAPMGLPAGGSPPALPPPASGALPPAPGPQIPGMMAAGGAVQTRQFGGPLGGLRPTWAGRPTGVGMGRPAWAGMGRPAFAAGAAPVAGLPPQAAAQAAAALAARPALPAVARGVRPFATGGRANGGKIGQMRKGKDYGEGSGSGRLEEFKHMKGRYP